MPGSLLLTRARQPQDIEPIHHRPQSPHEVGTWLYSSTSTTGKLFTKKRVTKAGSGVKDRMSNPSILRCMGRSKNNSSISIKKTTMGSFSKKRFQLIASTICLFENNILTLPLQASFFMLLLIHFMEAFPILFSLFQLIHTGAFVMVAR